MGVVAMNGLKHGGTYRTPDGKRYTAKAEDSDWTLVPPDFDQVDVLSWRASIKLLLFVEATGIFGIDFAGGPVARQTHWTVADLVPDQSNLMASDAQQ
jgi:hypothetical protein